MRPEAPQRSDFPVFRPIQTRWADNDLYGHVNNVQYYAYFDTAVNGYLIEQGLLDIHGGQVIGLVVSTACDYFTSVAFPDALEAGIAVEKLGGSSVRYRVGIFAEGSETASASGRFTHVYVDRETRRPVALGARHREVLGALTISA